MFAAVLLTGALALSAAGAPDTSDSWPPPVPPVDVARIGPDDFADDELDLPFYLVHCPPPGQQSGTLRREPRPID